MEITTLYNIVTLTPHQNQPNTQYPPWQYDLPQDYPLPLLLAPEIPREAIDQVVAEIISQGQAEFNKQWQELNELASSPIAQSNELRRQQEAQNAIFLAAKTTHNDLNTLQDLVKAEIAALLATSST